MKASALLAIALVAVLPAAGAATGVVAMRTADGSRVVLGADSAMSITSEPGGRDVYGAYGRCKIRRAGAWWVLLAGFSGTRGLDDFEAPMLRAVTAARTLLEALQAVQKTYRGPVRTQLLIPTSPYRTKLFEPGAAVMATIIAGVDQGVLSVGYYGLQLAPSSDFSLIDGWATCPGTLCDELGSAPWIWGASVGGSLLSDPDGLSPEKRPAWLARADVHAARRLVVDQVTATPDKVKTPINVLELDASGQSVWVGHDPRSACHWAYADGVRPF